MEGLPHCRAVLSLHWPLHCIERLFHCKHCLSKTKMVFTSDDRILIKVLRIERGYGAKRLLKEFPTKPWSLSAVKKLLVKIDATGSDTDFPAWPLRRAPLACGKLSRIFIFQDILTKICGNVSNWQTYCGSKRRMNWYFRS